MRYDPHSGAYIGAPADDPRTDAQKAADAPLEQTVSGAGGFLVGAIVGLMAGAIFFSPKRGTFNYD